MPQLLFGPTRITKSAYHIKMLAFIVLTVGLAILLGVVMALARRKEVMENWSKYRASPLILLTSFLYKPDEDPRSRLEFANDNFKEVLTTYVLDAFRVMLEPIFSIFYVMMTGMEQSMGGLNGVRAVSNNMVGSFQSMVEVFMRRFDFIFHQLRLTFFRIMTSMDRIWSIAINSVWQALSLTNAMLSTIDLIIKIVIIILVILLAMLFFLFLFAWPLIPLILSAVSIIAIAGSAGAVGGMSSAFCFDPAAPVRMSDGSFKPIAAVKLGDILADGGHVTATLCFPTSPSTALFDFGNSVRVTGSHVVFGPTGTAQHVRDHPDAVGWTGERPPFVYCLNTTTHRIPVGQHHVFADWEELAEDDREAQLRWNREVFEALNEGRGTWSALSAVIEAEAVLHPATQVRTPTGARDIGSLGPGDFVLDADGHPTRVVGIVRMAAAHVGTSNTFLGSGAWIRKTIRGTWEQAGGSEITAGVTPWVSLFTEAGSFLLDNGWGCRDFSDVGLENLEKTYSWVLEEITASL